MAHSLNTMTPTKTPKTPKGQAPTYHFKFDAETQAALQARVEEGERKGYPTTITAVVRSAVRQFLGLDKSK